MSSTKKCLVVSDSGDHTSRVVLEENIPRVEKINWKVNVTALTDVKKETLEPRGVFQLVLNDDKCNTTVMDMKLDELTKFYEFLEKVQNDLDEISAQ